MHSLAHANTESILTKMLTKSFAAMSAFASSSNVTASRLSDGVRVVVVNVCVRSQCARVNVWSAIKYYRRHAGSSTSAHTCFGRRLRVAPCSPPASRLGEHAGAVTGVLEQVCWNRCVVTGVLEQVCWNRCARTGVLEQVC